MATKQELTDMVSKLTAENNNLRSSTATSAAQKKKEQTVLSSVSGKTRDQINGRMEDLRTDLINGLDELRRKMESAHEELLNLHEAIKIKQAELSSTHEIEVAIVDLTSLLDLYAKKKEDLEIEFVSKKSELDRQTKELQEQHKVQVSTIQRELDLVKLERSTAEKRIKEEFEYSFTKMSKEKKDSFEYDLLMKRRVFDDENTKRIEFLNNRDEAIKLREESCIEIESSLADLQKDFDNFKKAREEEIAKALSESDSRHQASKAIALNSQTVKFEAEKSILTDRVLNKDILIKQLQDRIVTLEAQIQHAFSMINDVSMKTLDTSHLNDAMKRVEKAASEAMAKRPS